MYQEFEYMTSQQSKNYIEVHPDLAYVSIDSQRDDSELLEIERLIAVADREGLEQLKSTFEVLCNAGVIPSICLEPLGIEPEFDDNFLN